MGRTTCGRRQNLVLALAQMIPFLAACGDSTPVPSRASVSGSGSAERDMTGTLSQGAAFRPSQTELQAATEARLAGLRKRRNPIYDPSADARADIQAALTRIRTEDQRVLVEFGGNWCRACVRLHDLFEGDDAISAILRNEYALVRVDSRTNRDLMQEYGAGQSVPWLTVLDADGKVVVNQDAEVFEESARHDPEKIREFLEKWSASRE